jgi:hypothetical protein
MEVGYRVGRWAVIKHLAQSDEVSVGVNVRSIHAGC